MVFSSKSRMEQQKKRNRIHKYGREKRLNVCYGFVKLKVGLT